VLALAVLAILLLVLGERILPARPVGLRSSRYRS
jgi:hypothetical protein